MWLKISFHYYPNQLYSKVSTSSPCLLIMPSKPQREQHEFFKKKRSDASPLPNYSQLKTDDNKLSMVNTSDTEGESETWFWNESTNETDSDT